MISRLPHGVVSDIAVEYDSERVRLVKEKRDLERRMVAKLYDLSNEELYELSKRCNSDGFTDHCLYCEAWGLWHQRTNPEGARPE